MSGFVRTTAGMAVSAAALVVAGLMLLPAVAASAAAATNLLPNGTFDSGTTSGWKAVNASLGVARPGADGSTYAAKVTRATGTSYSMYAYPKPVTGLAAATQLQGSGEVLGLSGRPLCLMLQEYTAGGSLVQTVKGCVTGSGAWQTLPTVTLTVKTAGDSVGFRVRQAKAVTGDSFQADSLSLTEVTPPPPPPPPSGVVANWNMDEPAGSTTMLDSSGNGNNGTLKNGVQAGVPGETGTAYLFSGQSYVDVPSSNSLNPGTARADISVLAEHHAPAHLRRLRPGAQRGVPGPGVQDRAAAVRADRLRVHRIDGHRHRHRRTQPGGRRLASRRVRQDRHPSPAQYRRCGGSNHERASWVDLHQRRRHARRAPGLRLLPGNAG